MGYYDAERTAKMAPILNRIPEIWGKYLPGAGWDDLLLELDAKLSELSSDYAICQAKEKFATLRFYIDWFGENVPAAEVREQMQTLVQEYEARTMTLCESCGSKEATLRKSGWWKTFCDTCVKKEGKS